MSNAAVLDSAEVGNTDDGGLAVTALGTRATLRPVLSNQLSTGCSDGPDRVGNGVV
eukprot:EC712838.1.p3 GENE.EC712838.1~~EC712838.1.p3  ORF type:complete len:56 (-),score=4.90 EC712838.1:50-217(-)